MKTYEVTITETLQKTVEVEANSRQEAERLVEKNWNDSEYILDADSFVGVDFSARKSCAGNLIAGNTPIISCKRNR